MTLLVSVTPRLALITQLQHNSCNIVPVGTRGEPDGEDISPIKRFLAENGNSMKQEIYGAKPYIVAIKYNTNKR